MGVPASAPDLLADAHDFKKRTVLEPSPATWGIVKPMQMPWPGNTVTCTASSPDCWGSRGCICVEYSRLVPVASSLKSEFDSATVKRMLSPSLYWISILLSLESGERHTVPARV